MQVVSQLPNQVLYCTTPSKAFLLQGNKKLNGVNLQGGHNKEEMQNLQCSRREKTMDSFHKEK